MKKLVNVCLAACLLAALPAHAADATAARKAVKPGTFCDIQEAKACQDAVTPDMIMKRFQSGNARLCRANPKIKMP